LSGKVKTKIQITKFISNNESNQKTCNFGLKPSKSLIFNCPLKGGAIDARDIQGFSHCLKAGKFHEG
jgi:hypothetical protein